jgi:gentisate 1,2-dioxygenase
MPDFLAAGRAREGRIVNAAVPQETDLARFSRDISALNLMPLWERRVRMQPGSPCVPALWRYAEVRPHLLRSAELISKREAERRVLVLENPSLRGSTFITNTLYAGLQIILPGEIAPSHRHSPSALRFIVEGEGAYTAVEGEKLDMRPGDFIVTPSWAWHDHGNLGNAPVVWMDGLDTPFAQFFGAMFREDHPQERHPVTRVAGDNAARYGASLLPLERHLGQASPLLIYPYERTRAALAQLARGGDPHASHGYKLRYANPSNGAHPFPTMAVFMQMLPAGFSGNAVRSTDGTVFNVVEGRGSIETGEGEKRQRLDFGPHDVFVVPPWESYRFRAESECVLFSFSDRAAQEALGVWREDLG